MEQKDLESKLGKETLEALDKRYIRVSDNHNDGNRTNPIISKKQRIADFYNSLDDEEKFLLGMICSDPSDVVPDIGRAMRICSEQDNPCDDYRKLIDEKYKRIISHLSDFHVTPNGMGEGFPFHF